MVTTDMDRRDFLRLSLLAGVGATVASGLVSAVSPTRASALSTGSCVFGGHALPRGSEATQRESTLALEAEIGRTLGVFRRYSFWDDPPPDLTHLWAAQGGRAPYISWHAYTRNKTVIPWSSIAAGDQDAFIRTVGSAMASFGYPIYFSFHHEPENDTKNGTAAEFRAAFQRVRSLFDQQGATNVTWLCALMASTYKGGHGGADAWLPDPGTYSYVGVDGYNRWPLIATPAWRSFDKLFAPADQKAVQLGKPLFVAEFGCVEQVQPSYTAGDPNAKAAWFQGVGQTTQQWGNVAALCYSHAGATFNGKLMPYWVDSSSVSLDAFTALGHSAYFA
jgi:hypothetical protein